MSQGFPTAAGFIFRFFNPEMNGYTVYADFNRLSKSNETPFSGQWQSCNDDLSITEKYIDDWSFNKKNISDIESCSVNHQRYFSKNF